VAESRPRYPSVYCVKLLQARQPGKMNQQFIVDIVALGHIHKDHCTVLVEFEFCVDSSKGINSGGIVFAHDARSADNANK
jgi:hypothetical protein